MRKPASQGLIILLCFSGCLKGACSDTTDVLKRNIAYGCVGGKELMGVVGFERIIALGEKLNWSLSLGVQPFLLSKKFSAPLAISAFTKERPHHLEVDLMATFYMDKYHPYNGGWKDDFNKQLYISPFVGYRFQGNHWLVFKAGVGPQLLLDPPSGDVANTKTKIIPISGYGSLGISF